jgi:hypothetical protein
MLQRCLRPLAARPLAYSFRPLTLTFSRFVSSAPDQTIDHSKIYVSETYGQKWYEFAEEIFNAGKTFSLEKLCEGLLVFLTSRHLLMET